MKIYTLTELLARPPRKAKVKTDRDGLHLAQCCNRLPPDDWHYSYFIGWQRIDTPMKLIHWVRHLSEKSWVDGQVIEELIDACNRKHKLGVWETRI
jgi:hypothetical protein